MKAIIVDDEPMTRSGLRRFVDWEGLGIEVAGEAEDGIEAYERFVQVRPDIVLCDVRMPRMDGIAFAQRVREIDVDCKIIFLSGYNDLDYLKSAIKLQAVDYMLKPIQMDELGKLLKETVRNISDARRKRRELEELQSIREQFDHSKPELIEHLVKMIVQPVPDSAPEGAPIEERLGQLAPSFPARGFYQCVAFEFRDEEARSRWRTEAQEAAAELELPVLTALTDGMGIACAALSSPRGDDRLGLWLNRLIRMKAEDGLLGVAAGTGEICAHLTGCKASFSQAVKALSQRFYRGWNTAIPYHIPRSGYRSGLFDKQAFIKFEDLLRNKQPGEAKQWLDQTINELLLYTPPEVEAVRKKLFRWYVAMTRIYPETMWEFEKDQLWATMFVSGELYTIRKFMMQRLDIIQQALEHTDSGDKMVIRDIIRYIQDNYSKDVSINTLAGHVHLAPTYMCILFKKEKGVSINDFITQYRIEQAKRLLRDRRLKLYEVSSMVGYQDANYFAKVFRKLTGVIPSQYRNALPEE
ncbi:response regulator [Paenibacillus cisolokensis]